MTCEAITEINPDDPAAARVVGRRVKPSPLKVVPGEIEHAREWRKAFPTPFVPKGLYRFNTHEAAAEWMWKMITRPKQA
jgi:hypothetical protein